jgi:DNA-directed RNA polymerase subunit RPC12/RpoP
MTSAAGTTKARCVHCREEVEILERYAHGDHIRCGACGTDHKILRGDRVRLVHGDVAPLRDALAQNEQLIHRLETALARARTSFGIGANGLVIALFVAVYRVLVGGRPIDKALLWTSLAIALVSGVLLELANWSVLAKRRAITALSGELADAEADGNRLRAQIRDATRT